MSEGRQRLRDLVFRGLLFESEAEAFRQAGIRVGADLGQSEQALLLEALAPFGLQRRNEALQMARLYAVLNAFENELRSLIRDTLEEKIGVEWWDSAAVPTSVRRSAQSRKQTAEKDFWLKGSKTDSLGFVDFGDLSSILVNNWAHFEALLPTQEWVKARLGELEKARNFVAHNRMLEPSEFQRLFMYVADWNEVVGL